MTRMSECSHTAIQVIAPPPAMSVQRPPLLFDAANGIFATPAAYNLSSTKTAIQMRAVLHKTPTYSRPANCIAQCTRGAQHLCLAPRYNLADLQPLNATSPNMLTATCDIIESQPNGPPAKYKYKYGNEFYGGMRWVPQAKVIQPAPPAVKGTESECFTACDLDAECWVATYFLQNTTCMHFPMASGDDSAAAGSKVWWIWEARPGFKLEESGLKGVQNFTEVVGKVHLEKGIDMPSAAVQKKIPQSLMGLVMIVLLLVQL